MKVMSPLTPRKCYKVKYYAVRVGRKAGIYKTWSECKEQVCEYSGAIYKSFFHESDAKKYMEIKPPVSAYTKLSTE